MTESIHEYQEREAAEQRRDERRQREQRHGEYTRTPAPDAAVDTDTEGATND